MCTPSVENMLIKAEKKSAPYGMIREFKTTSKITIETHVKEKQFDQFQLSSYDYQLPSSLIAQYPLEKRDGSRLLIPSKPQPHHLFADVIEQVTDQDLIVFNDTKVLKVRLFGKKATGGQVEVFILSFTAQFGVAFIKASKSPKANSIVEVQGEAGFSAQLKVLEQLTNGQFKVAYDGDWLELFAKAGHLPLPPYIDRAVEAKDNHRYQTLWASKPGAVAAPTASLHFSQTIIDQLKARSIDMAWLTLHVGAGTFAPVRVEDIRQHQMHAEYYEVGAELLQALKTTKARGGRVFAIGTTVLRTLESIVQLQSLHDIQPHSAQTEIFITPGFKFKIVDCLLTNFHLPKSTLLMLVSAFAGAECIRQAYQIAINDKYRFFSYGDAMLLDRL